MERFPPMELMEAIGGNVRLPHPLFISLFALTDFEDLKGDSVAFPSRPGAELVH